MLKVFTPKPQFKVILVSFCKIESKIRAHVLLKLLNSLRKGAKMIGKPRFYILSPTQNNM